MDNTPHPPTDITSSTTGSSTRKAGLFGGVLGAAGLAVSVVALSSTAGATPSLAAQDAEPAPAEDVITEAEGTVVENGELPPGFEEAAACFDAVAEKFGVNIESAADFDNIDWDAFDAESDVCNELLPEDMQIQMIEENEQFEEYDTCVAEAFESAGIDLEMGATSTEAIDLGGVDSVVDVESFLLEEIEADGTVVGGNSISAVEAEAWGELDDALSGCDDKLPEGFDDELFAASVGSIVGEEAQDAEALLDN